MQVIDLQLDTNELLTVESMGTTVPVLLFVVCLKSERIFYVCLNDYIDKVLIPAHENYASSKTRLIHVPVQNEITEDSSTLKPLLHYAKRAKLFAAFMRFLYQETELRDILNQWASAVDLGLSSQARLAKQSYELLKHFMGSLKRLKIWKSAREWPPLYTIAGQLDACEAEIRKTTAMNDNLAEIAMGIWKRLNTLGRLYEEVCREWFLPTFTAEVLR